MVKPYMVYITILYLYCINSLIFSFATDPMLFLIICILPVTIVIASYAFIRMWLKEIAKTLKKRGK